uniref:Uncharacterized protein n=1 Tax=Setaria viridis TaxID=4556 RepID=A0A4U6SYV4_SETVI|nr:hypothetical protein SEVIR_9G282101v2 [Setaria viridis]
MITFVIKLVLLHINGVFMVSLASFREIEMILHNAYLCISDNECNSMLYF